MKKIILLFFCIQAGIVDAQRIAEKEVKTEVSEVTVFTEGAQVTRKKTVDLQQGPTILKFTELSPFIDPKSVQVKAVGAVMVISVNHQLNFLEQLDKSNEMDELITKLAALEDKIKLENTRVAIIGEELAFLQTNRNIGGKNQEVNISNLMATSDYYHERLTLLKLGEIERAKNLEQLVKERNNIQKQIASLSGKKEFPKGEILVKVETKAPEKADFELSYLVANAGWFPAYDIRVKNVNEPVELTYKANVRQDTKEDWKNVRIRLSSADPNVNSIAPELKSWYLNYHTAPPTYRLSSNQVRGTVASATDNEPLPGVIVMVKGSTLGTNTDLNGAYTLTLPEKADILVFSYVGYMTQEVPIRGSTVNVQMSEDIRSLSEVVVVGYGSAKRKDAPSVAPGMVSGMTLDKSQATTSIAMPTAQVENQTSVEFEIKIPYTINSDNKVYAIDIEGYSLPAQYEYYSAPKVNRDAFLLAYVVNWERYNLLEGEASIFFEGTYVGKSLLDVRYIADTLTLSLGRDKNVVVKREKLKDYATRQFIGNKKEEVRAWNISVKNNKSQKINMLVADQVPISTLEEIEVDVKTNSGGTQNAETGEVTWKFSLEPSGSKDFELRYGVKYPKNKNLVIE